MFHNNITLFSSTTNKEANGSATEYVDPILTFSHMERTSNYLSKNAAVTTYNHIKALFGSMVKEKCKKKLDKSFKYGKYITTSCLL